MSPPLTPRTSHSELHGTNSQTTAWILRKEAHPRWSLYKPKSSHQAYNNFLSLDHPFMLLPFSSTLSPWKAKTKGWKKLSFLENLAEMLKRGDSGSSGASHFHPSPFCVSLPACQFTQETTTKKKEFSTLYGTFPVTHCRKRLLEGENKQTQIS